MSFRGLTAVALAAFALRLGFALVTEVTPIFPAYYYNDSRFIDSTAAGMANAWQSHTPYPAGIAPERRAHALMLAGIYRVFGHRPLLGKIANAALGATAAALLVLAAGPALGPGPALTGAAVVALWPSHAFFTSQNFKDGMSLLLLWSALALLSMAASAPQPRRAARCAIPAAILLALVGFFRSYLMVTALLGAAAAFAIKALRRSERGAALAGLACALMALPLYIKLAAFAYAGPLADVSSAASTQPTEDALLLKTTGGHGAVTEPFSLEGLTRTRHWRQDADRRYSLTVAGREIGTQLFPNADFTSWFDLLVFLPRAAFYVLFMPLPGLYPIGRNLGRIAASLENLAILALALLALRGALRRRPEPSAALLLVFFAATAAGSALFEFDLGSATHHRIAYLPALFPFAFAGLGLRRKPREGVLKVFQVLECGGPGGTGNQVAAVCNGLDPRRFETTLIYAVRPGCSAEEYRAKAAGAKQAVFVPEMVRSISPANDWRAFRRLVALFRAEQPDVVHAHSSKAGILARWAAWIAGVPRVFYTPHGYGFLQQDHSPVKRALYRAVEAASSWIGTIVAVSPSEAELARPLAWGKPVTVVCDPYLGELPAAGGPRPHEGLLVGSCGRMTYARNPDAFVNLAQRLTDSRNGLKCVWIGGGDQEAEIRKQADNMNLQGRLEVTGWLDSAEAQGRLGSLDVLVHYSRWDGLPNAVLEAMAHGLPVVASDAPGARDAVVHGETGFLAKNEIELLELTLRLIDEPELRRRLGAAGRRRVEAAFRLEQALAKLEALYAGRA
jgi:glycosyltransferase involved in cell wall biosynthesis